MARPKTGSPPGTQGKEIGMLTVLGWSGNYHVFPRGTRLKKVLCKCRCGNEIEILESYILRKNARSDCGCRPPKYINKTYHKLTIIGWGEKEYNGSRCVKCLCNCGNFCDKHQGSVVAGKVYSCGCSTILGDKIKQLIETKTKVKKLTILSISDKVGPTGAMYCNVICDCGIQKCVRAAKLMQESEWCLNSCGNCTLMKNGRATSHIVVKLHKMIGGKHNHYIEVRNKNNQRMNIDIAFPNEKIAIEYDGWYYHKNPEKDEEQTRLLNEAGWKVLGIKSRRSLPTLEEINKSLDKLRNGLQIEIIELKNG